MHAMAFLWPLFYHSDMPVWTTLPINNQLYSPNLQGGLMPFRFSKDIQILILIQWLLVTWEWLQSFPSLAGTRRRPKTLFEHPERSAMSSPGWDPQGIESQRDRHIPPIAIAPIRHRLRIFSLMMLSLIVKQRISSRVSSNVWRARHRVYEPAFGPRTRYLASLSQVCYYVR